MNPRQTPRGTERTERTEWHRPALDVLAGDVREVREEMLDGFRSREALIWWMHDLCRATLGQVDIDLLVKLGRELSTVTDEGEVASISALLTPAARERTVDETAAERLREAMATRLIEPAHHRAVRVLQVSATEYVDDDGDEAETSGHDPSRQRATAMRPSVDETVARQRQVLEDLLDGRLDEDPGGSGEYLHDWVDRLDVATDGLLSILDSMTVESSFRELLTGDGIAHARGRELLAGRWLIPVSCLAIRRVAVGASEVPDAAPLDKEIPMA